MNKFQFVTAVVCGLLVFTQHAAGQGNTEVKFPVLTGEGIVGDIDTHRRSPVVSLGQVNDSGGVRLLVDAFEPDTEYSKYPIRFDFFINRQLFSSQVRSLELPGPIGVYVPKTTAAIPFNYMIVATLLHPNRQFTTVIQGAAFAANFTATLDCTLTLPPGTDNSEESNSFVANAVSTSQSTSTGFSVAFDGKNVTDDTSASVSAPITVSGTTAKSTISITKDGTTTTSETSGTVESKDSVVTSISLTSSDGATSLSCS